MTILLVQLRSHVGLTTDLLAFTLVVTVTAVVGGFPPAAIAAISSFLLANWYFTPPIHTWSIAEPENLAALLVFLGNAGVIGRFVSVAAKRMAAANRARAHAETLAAMAGAAMGDEELLPTLVAQLRKTLGATGAAILRPREDGWAVDAADGEIDVSDPLAAPLVIELDDGARLIAFGPDLPQLDDRVLDAFTRHVASAAERQRLRLEADRAERLSEANDLRSGLLAAVSHDLRTPLTAIKAAASTLEQPEVVASDELRHEFVTAITDHTDRLTALVTNLLEMSRIQAQAVELATGPVALDEVVPSALLGIDTRGVEVNLQLDESLPRILADRTLLERVIANVIDNAVKWSPPNEAVRVDAVAVGDKVALRVVDSGPGIPRDRRTDVLQPFQRIGDTTAVEGTGLGLAVAHGFLTQMGAGLEIDDTPGGGTTMTMTFLAASARLEL